MPATLIALALAAYFLLLRYADVESSLVDRGHSLIHSFTPATEYGVFSGNRGELHSLAKALSRETGITAVSIYDRGGIPLTLVGTLRLSRNPLQLADGWTERSEDGKTQAFHAKIWRPVLSLDDPLTWPEGTQPKREAIGSITLEISRSGVLARKQEMMVVTLLATLAALALGALLALRLSRDVSAPILSLQRAVENIRGGHLETRVTYHPARTLRGLEDGINEMAAALQAGRDQLENRIAEATAELKNKKDEAEQASIAKSRFLAAASHDLRQPLHALALFAAELGHEAANARQRRLAGQIGTAVSSLGELLDGMLDVSRVDLGATRPDLQPIALDGLLGRVVSAYSRNAEAKGLALRLHPTRAWGLSDPILLYRMVSNLVANAIRYTDHGGILVGVRRAGDKVRIEVWDTGIGIAEEHHALIFQEFFQAANPERDPGKGLGLGLALVDRLSRLLDLPVCLRSAMGSGSIFGITLPRCAPMEMKPDTAGPAILGGFNARVLVFGATRDTGASLCSLLASWGCQAICAEAGAADQIAAPPDLVLCEDHGCQAARAFLLAMAAGGAKPALILIGNAAIGLDPELPGNRVMRLRKPVLPAKLRALMHHLLEEDQPAQVRAEA